MAKKPGSGVRTKAKAKDRIQEWFLTNYNITGIKFKDLLSHGSSSSWKWEVRAGDKMHTVSVNYDGTVSCRDLTEE